MGAFVVVAVVAVVVAWPAGFSSLYDFSLFIQKKGSWIRQ